MDNNYLRDKSWARSFFRKNVTDSRDGKMLSYEYIIIETGTLLRPFRARVL